MNAGIIGLGAYLPPNIVTNQDIVDRGVDTSNDWIVERTGIRERRVCSPEMSTTDMAYEASLRAIEDAGINKHQIDLIIVGTTSPDYPGFPSCGSLLQHRLGLGHIGAFDLAAACSGFNYSLTTAKQFVRAGQCKNVLVVGADCLSKYIDWEDRSICVLFGDGAGAAIVSAVPENTGIIQSRLYTDGSQADILKVPAGGSRAALNPQSLAEKQNKIYMNGRAVFKVAVNSVVPAVIENLEAVGLTPQDIDYFVPHQANLRIIDHARKKLRLSDSQVIVNVDRYGNTSAASVPIALAESKEAGIFKPGDIIVSIGFGAGFTWGVNIIRWAS